MQSCYLRHLTFSCSKCTMFYHQILPVLKGQSSKNLRLVQHILNSHSYFVKSERYISFSSVRHYEIIPRLAGQSEVNLKKDATMIHNMLKYNAITSELRVENKVYNLNKNVYVVGLGKAAMGMARVVEDMLGQHIVEGIITIPKGVQQQMVQLQLNEILLAENSKIEVYEGAECREVDEACYSAAKAISKMVEKLTEQDLLIVLSSAGGSILCPSPEPPITLQDLRDVTRLLQKNGASVREINILRKNIEILKGGGLALKAKPAQVLSLTLLSVIGDTADLISSGPTCPTQPTPFHCIEILKRLNIMDQTPETIRRFLERQCKNLENSKATFVTDPVSEKALYDATWKHVQNIVVGSNSIACEAAADKAVTLGYVPIILTTAMTGEARKVGSLYARLAKFIMICFDRKASFEPNSELSILETALVAEGIRKQWINSICQEIEKARNSDRDVCIIVGGNTFVTVCGTGIGGKNMESAISVTMQLQEEFRIKKLSVEETPMCFLSCDTDGYDGNTKVAGAVVDQDFLQEVLKSGLDMRKYLDNNDSFTFFNQVNGGQNLVPIKLTGTNVMDIVILLVKRPRQEN
ncbi:unnamed protein product [Candidula unifasciata]|uniref:Glycerate kinase n=1 Tax=Candidula unifasciata TaxID=100452 RepID=A0A8S4A3U8_9EUPU|nr:unnamed protein product [Candidula unifasciata]